jgi:hypothetical protein
MTRMAKTLMPYGGGSGSKGGRRRKLQQIEGTGAITPGDLSPRGKNLHRTAKRVKFHRTIVVGSELTHRNKVLNKVRRNKNIVKMKVMREMSGAGSGNKK